MLKKFAPVILMVLCVALFLGAVFWYFTLPVVGIDQDGKCAWVENQYGRVMCPAVLPTKYIEVRVK